MFEWFTEKAIKVILLAQEESRSSGHNYLGTEQILLGLINIGYGLAFRVLSDAGVTLEAARSEVEKIVDNGSDIVGKDVPFTPRTKRVLELAWDEARQLRHNYIGTEHLLLGLIREGDGLGPRVLCSLGLDLPELRRHILEIMVEHYKKAAANDPSDMNSFGSSGRVLFLLQRYTEAYEYFSRAIQMPGGEFYKADAEACKQHLQNIEKF